MGDLNRVSSSGSLSRAELTSTYSRGYIEVTVSDPITHHTWDQGRFTTYQVTLETNNRAFSVMKTTVRRRYSEFKWLQDVLSNHFPDIKTPPLPPKKFFGGQFHPEVIEARKMGLSEFMQKVVDEPVYLSENALHLFLQTQLSIPAIEDCIQGKSEKGVTETILDHVQKKDTLSLPLDAEYLSQQDASVNSSFASSPHDIFSPTRPHSMDFHSSDESGSLGSETTGPQINKTVVGPSDSKNGDCEAAAAPPALSSENAEVAQPQGDKPARFLRVRSMPQIAGGFSYRSASEGASNSFTGRSSLRTVSSSLDLASDPRRPKRRVTFSPEVTVAEIIDRFSKSPRNVKREDMPSVIIASTMAY